MLLDGSSTDGTFLGSPVHRAAMSEIKRVICIGIAGAADEMCYLIHSINLWVFVGLVLYQSDAGVDTRLFFTAGSIG